jgi:thiol:disulfide interchange protein
MKKIGLIIIVICFVSAANAQEKIKWHTLPEAIELNKKEPRKFMIDVYTDWCGWCKRMDATTFSNDTIVS